MGRRVVLSPLWSASELTTSRITVYIVNVRCFSKGNGKILNKAHGRREASLTPFAIIFLLYTTRIRVSPPGMVSSELSYGLDIHN